MHIDGGCGICGRYADVLAAYWLPGTGVFSPPDGYACRDCKPEEFLDLDDLFGGGES